MHMDFDGSICAHVVVGRFAERVHPPSKEIENEWMLRKSHLNHFPSGREDRVMGKERRGPPMDVAPWSLVLTLGREGRKASQGAQDDDSFARVVVPPPGARGGVGLRTGLNESLAHGGEVVLRDRGRMHPGVQTSLLACSNGILRRDRGMPSGLPTPCCGGEGGPRYGHGHGQVQGRAKDCEHDGGSRSFVHAVGRDRFTSMLASSLASCVH
eukprot:scaffold73_cov337-Pavlova_lutheri.AAC.79